MKKLIIDDDFLDGDLPERLPQADGDLPEKLPRQADAGVAAIKEHYGQQWIELVALPNCPGNSCPFLATGGCKLPESKRYVDEPCEQLRIFMEAAKETLYDEFNILNNVDRMIIGITCLPYVQMLAQMRLESQAQPMQGFSKKSGMMTPFKINKQFMEISKDLRNAIYQLDYKKKKILESWGNNSEGGGSGGGDFRNDKDSLVQLVN